jgi:hypothetical protein
MTGEKINIPAVLDYLAPGAAWGWGGWDVEKYGADTDTSCYGQLRWEDEKIPKPTWEEIQAAWPTVKAQIAQAEKDVAARTAALERVIARELAVGSKA